MRATLFRIADVTIPDNILPANFTTESILVPENGASHRCHKA
jgi:hypothetical protein